MCPGDTLITDIHVCNTTNADYVNCTDPAAPPPQVVQKPEMEPIEYINMDEDNETEEDILER
jgi:hypothetical protein